MTLAHIQYFLPVTVANEGLLLGFPTTNVIKLVVTVTGRRANPRYILHSFNRTQFTMF